MDEAIKALEELHERVKKESWLDGGTQHAILAGIRMSIRHLQRSAKQ